MMTVNGTTTPRGSDNLRSIGRWSGEPPVREYARRLRGVAPSRLDAERSDGGAHVIHGDTDGGYLTRRRRRAEWGVLI